MTSVARRKRRRGGSSPRDGRLARSEVATLRLDPKLHYFIGLAARYQRRTISSYLEWAAEQSLDRVLLIDPNGSYHSIASKIEQLWDVDKIDRFIKLAFHRLDLLNHDEQVLWKLVKENDYLWQGSANEKTLADLNRARLHRHWDDFVAVANGKADKSILPN